MSDIKILIPSDFEADLTELQDTLDAEGIAYEVSSSGVTSKDLASLGDAAFAVVSCSFVQSVAASIVANAIWVGLSPLCRKFRFRRFGNKVIAEVQTEPSDSELQRQKVELESELLQMSTEKSHTTKSQTESESGGDNT